MTTATATATRRSSPALRERLLMLWERTNDVALRDLAHGGQPIEGARLATEDGHRNLVSTCLMNAFKNTGDTQALALLYELNSATFLRQITRQLWRLRALVDPDDVLQEVFLNICRYPNRFVADHADAFNGWAHRIVRNTAFRFVKSESNRPVALAQLHGDDDFEPEDKGAPAPGRVAEERESASVVNLSYVLFLTLYLHHFQRLSPREQRTLTLAQIEGWPYSDIAAEVGCAVLNVKMTVFRGRRRILRGMTESLAALERMEFTVDHDGAGKAT